MQNELYSDGIGEITVTGSVVRIDLMSLSATERDVNNNPKSVFRQRIILSVEAFANSVDLMQKALQGLVDAGVVRRNPSPHTAGTTTGQLDAATAPHEDSTRTAQRAKASPTFG
jgi:hypothetical protein